MFDGENELVIKIVNNYLANWPVLSKMEETEKLFKYNKKKYKDAFL